MATTTRNTGDPDRCCSRRFPASPEAVAEVRHWAAAVLAGHPRRDDGVLVVSELASNSARYSVSGGGGEVAVEIAVCGRAVRICVADGGGPTMPHLVPAEERAEGGRGLAMVETLSSMWGYLSSGDGATTWCELTVAA